jgi:GNAT superfamily N-acetyltransferase
MSQLNPPLNTLVRRAVVDESPTISRVLYQAFVEFEAQYTPAAFAATTPASNEIKKRWHDGPVWVAVRGCEPLGTISAISKSEGLYIRSMAVLPSTRGHGIGHLLLQAAEQFAIAQASQCMFLSTCLFLTGAIQLYERFGFQRSSAGPHELFGTPIFSMVKLLEHANQD